MILAPRSVMEILHFFITAPFSGVTKQPQFLGLVKTKAISIANNEALSYTIDGNSESASELIIETENRVLNLLVNEDFPISDGAPSSKEQRKITRLPTGEAVLAMASKPLPFIAHAATEEFKELYQIQLVTPTSLTGVDLDNIKKNIETKLQRKVIMEAQVIICR